MVYKHSILCSAISSTCIHIHVTTCMLKKVHMERSNLRFAYCKDYGICKTLKSFDSKVIST